MDSLRERILAEGENLGRGILKIDSFLNHQVDAALMEKVGEEIGATFRHSRPTRILTAEVSGIVPAVMAAKALDTATAALVSARADVTVAESQVLSAEVVYEFIDEFVDTVARLQGMLEAADARG